MIRLNDIKTDLNFDSSKLKEFAAEYLHKNEKEIERVEIVRKSIDARNKNNVFFVYTFDVILKEEASEPVNIPIKKEKTTKFRPIIIGSGPAGMFAGLVFAEVGLKPVIIERGSEIKKRKSDVDLFWKTGKLNTESNVQFGEGGAGTFSDGKLMSGIKKDENTAKILKEFVAAGAPEEILYLAKPHIGTDNLEIVVKNIRKKIVSLGGEYRFDTKLNGLVIKNNELQAIILESNNEKTEFITNNIILAIGHSARDTFEMLYNSGLKMEQKSFAVGARIEHKQYTIDKSQYGKFAGHKALGAADYKLAVHLPNGRCAYTFCMCPGGEVVASSSEVNSVVTNGMSCFSRNKDNANSALLVNIMPEDFENKHPLAGIEFQRKLEKKAFSVGGKNYKAPAQLVGDMLKNKASSKLGDVKASYKPGVIMTDLGEVLPRYVVDSMRLALMEMDNKIKGFASYDAVLTGVETRSSSPVRIVRDENMQSNIKGIYPCGEGAGYAGGIMSAAVDGIKSALKIIGELK